MAEDVIDRITRDHREMLRLGGRLRADPERRAAARMRLDALVRGHVRAVERHVHPLVTRELAVGQPVDERTRALDRRMETLLDRLARSAPGSEYEAVADRMVDAVTEHVRFEEAEVLPHLRGALAPERLASLGELYGLARDR
ncbi:MULTISPECIES: hemerythrin domain-containing protein [Kitasatospora]|uniref:Hemerythrin-like domain-containing protein n=2 Tax=Kitasatospora TaxID=2063 RepID=A0ABT1J2I4_9ACTN|nr:hemerythrin domain-containing protein [Kitasatospora paracochleata]MCP2311642.1 hypothetical protein [Kitasatospora paracochleata]